MANIEELQKLASAIGELAERRATRIKDFFKPYPKQKAFFDLGVACRERLLIAGNQVGKSECAAFEVACHLTGEYPDWWNGRRFDHPVKLWAAGKTSQVCRDVQQKKLCGEPGAEGSLGTGFIPRDAFSGKPTMSRGITDAYDTVFVVHNTDGIADGISILRFKSYEQGRQKFQGDTLDLIWCDEEPPMDVYSECLTRVTATGGMVFITFTPLEGKTEIVCRFLDEASPDRGIVTMTIEEAEHIPAEKRAAIIAGYPVWQREARAHGVPMLGSGKVFQVAESDIRVDPIPIPAHWRLIWGFDFGIDHPFAAVLLAWDFDTDTCYVTHCIRMKDAMPLQHVEAMKPLGLDIPVAWPQDGWQRQECGGDLKPMAAIYRKHGAKMLQHHATFSDGSNSTEAGIMDMQERMRSNRFKVFSTCAEWFDEFRQYHRKDGEIVKVGDDLMSATRVAVMMKRSAQAVRFYREQQRVVQTVQVARDVDFDVFGS